MDTYEAALRYLKDGIDKGYYKVDEAEPSELTPIDDVLGPEDKTFERKTFDEWAEYWQQHAWTHRRPTPS